MNPAIASAKKLYDEQGLRFEAVLAHYLDHGYVFVEPGRLVMGSPVREEQPDKIAAPGEADCWHVHLAVGEGAMKWFIRQMPWYLPKICWRREFKANASRLHVWPTDKLINKLR